MTLRAVPLLAVTTVAACAIAIGDRKVDRSAAEARGAILAVLEEQAAAWNRGDLEGFMDGYWRSPELVFTSGGRVQRGWQTTLDRYRATYGSDRESMGRLAFSDVEVHSLDEDAAWVLGRWSLDRRGGQVGGVFTLVLRRLDGHWRIVHDHTSTSP